MLFSILRFLLRLSTKGYFRSIYVKGVEHIPDKGPIIIASNHPSAFMDPILLSTKIDRKLFFLTRGDIFKTRFTAFLLSMLNMIPVYRKVDSTDREQRNDAIFQKCFEHLAKGKPILIFPEGTSKTERKLRPVKTGTARIALGAEALHEFKLGVKVIPVGINYANPHIFRSDVFVNFGEPIDISEFKDIYLRNDREAVTALTERIKAEMENLFVVVEDERLENIVGQIEKLYRSKLRGTSDLKDKGILDFYISKDIVMAIDYHFKHHPQKLAAFHTNITAYLNGLKELHIRDTQVRASSLNIDVARSVFFFAAGLPLFCFGVCTNYLPFKLSQLISRSLRVKDSFVGSIKLSVGMFTFLLVYTVQFLGMTYWISVWWAIIVLVSFYPAGVFSLMYIRKYLEMIGTLKYLRLFMDKGDLVAKLKLTRQELIDELEEGKEEYLAQR
ncbi:MAG: lysophospholipid acyltransferase family protein [Cyclobacteriaceae bacterium]|jgi:glycerol-3-phosphate O-acyltransferase/dihydroxyacetone phosphate acyltransferase|nr:lysophospholipid acyltransferase family protein [Cyclobacteriaceae bacterium]MDH5249224.1 lysophospholipid acyltransferase family protein [Cyclobacteriaceae bacterium]